MKQPSNIRGTPDPSEIKPDLMSAIEGILAGREAGGSWKRPTCEQEAADRQHLLVSAASAKLQLSSDYAKTH